MAHVEDRSINATVNTAGPANASVSLGAVSRVAVATADDTHAAGRLFWYREVAAVLSFYFGYSMIRNLFGSNAVDPSVALRNALRVVTVERYVGSFAEADFQRFFLEWSTPFVRFWNLYYGTLHFVATAGVMVWLFRRRPDIYPRWRNGLAAMTGLALVGFSLFPLMPPRLLADTGIYGGGDLRFSGFVDTLHQFPTLWSFNSGTMQSVSNQYAAMPSLHVGWSLWCVAAVLPFVRPLWGRVLVALYVPATAFAIVVTANHYWIDALGGLAVFTVGYLIAGRIDYAKGLRRQLPVANRPTAAGNASTLVD